MPAGDGTGPLGFGPMTGRAAGFCAGYPMPGYMNPVPGRAYRGAPLYGAGFYPRIGACRYRMLPPYGPAWGYGGGRGRGRVYGSGWRFGYGRGFGRGLGRGFGRGRAWSGW
ncbi:MAG TPA: DUF5320 domain-containing protein [Planctomycetota bacterium]|nr:DUF5320 domain-containing protein [Planctomycetota bacterium]